MSNLADNMGIDPSVVNGSAEGTPPAAPDVEVAPKTQEQQEAEAREAAEKQKIINAEALLAEKKVKEAEAVVADDKPADAEPKDGEASEKNDDEPAPEGEVVIEDWGHVGNEAADAAIDLMQEKGMTPQDANAVFGKSLSTGKLEDVNIGLLTEKVGASAAKLVMSGLKSWHSAEASKANETVQAVYKEMGGEANWTKVQAWAKSTKSEKFRAAEADLRTMLDAGGTQAVLAAKEIKGMYEAEQGTVDKTLVQGDAVVETGIAPLSRSEYHAQVKAVEQNETNPRIKAEKLAQLSTARKAGRAAGK